MTTRVMKAEARIRELGGGNEVIDLVEGDDSDDEIAVAANRDSNLLVLQNKAQRKKIVEVKKELVVTEEAALASKNKATEEAKRADEAEESRDANSENIYYLEKVRWDLKEMINEYLKVVTDVSAFNLAVAFSGT